MPSVVTLASIAERATTATPTARDVSTQHRPSVGKDFNAMLAAAAQA